MTLPKEIQDGVARATISPGHAREILRIDDEALQLKIYAIILENNLSVRDTERGVNRLLKAQKEEGKRTVPGKPDTLLYAICDSMIKIVGTNKLQLKEFKKRRKIELTIGTTEQLIELLSKLSKLKLSKDDLATMKEAYEKKIAKANKNFLEGEGK